MTKAEIAARKAFSIIDTGWTCKYQYDFFTEKDRQELLESTRNLPDWVSSPESISQVADFILWKASRMEEVFMKNMDRFVHQHELTYEQALQEVKNGKKETHWIWWIFPQLKRLNVSKRSRFYGLSREGAEIFLNHPILGKHLVEITQAVLDSDKTPYQIFGNDTIKFRSCMLLFASLENTNPIFKKVINKYCWK